MSRMGLASSWCTTAQRFVDKKWFWGLTSAGALCVSWQLMQLIVVIRHCYTVAVRLLLAAVRVLQPWTPRCRTPDELLMLYHPPM